MYVCMCILNTLNYPYNFATPKRILKSERGRSPSVDAELAKPFGCYYQNNIKTVSVYLSMYDFVSFRV